MYNINRTLLGGGFGKDFWSVHPETLGKIPIVTNIYQRGWFNHQLEYFYLVCMCIICIPAVVEALYILLAVGEMERFGWSTYYQLVISTSWTRHTNLYVSSLEVLATI